MSADPQSIQRALDFHNAGRLAEAEAAYRAILANRPNEADVLHLLGVVCSQQGRKDEAVQHIKRAISLQPGAAEFHNNLAMVYLERGRFDQAAAAAQSALALRNDYVVAMNILANALRKLGRFSESIGWFERSLAAKSDQPEVLSALVEVLRLAGRNDQAEARMKELMIVHSAAHDALVRNGEALLNENRLEEAAGAFRALMQQFPQSWVGFNGLALAIFRLGRFNEALPLFQKSIELAPDNPGPFNNLGHACMTEGHLEQAIEVLKKAVAIRPDFAEAYNNLGSAYLYCLDIGQARRAYERALFFQPDNRDAHWNIAFLMLLSGDWLNGFREYEWRWLKFPKERRSFREPLWSGLDIRGKTILLYAEQGFGDTIQFARFASMVAARGAKVILECAPGLVSLMSRTTGVTQVVARGSALPHFDFHCPLMSTAYVLGATLDTIPRDVPYVHFDPGLQQDWGHRIAPYKREFNVGIAWAGSSTQSRNRERSAKLEAFAPLADLKGVRFFSVQIGDAPRTSGMAGPDLVDLTRDIRSFDDTAALIANLDLVISVDTGVCHLAGAMGKPTFAMLAYSADWRWLLDRDDSPWYPTVRLFRQPVRGDWPSVILRIREAIAQSACTQRSGE